MSITSQRLREFKPANHRKPTVLFGFSNLKVVYLIFKAWVLLEVHTFQVVALFSKVFHQDAKNLFEMILGEVYDFEFDQFTTLD